MNSSLIVEYPKGTNLNPVSFLHFISSNTKEMFLSQSSLIYWKKKPSISHHWAYSKKFWWEYFFKNKINWIIALKDTLSLMKVQFGEKPEPSSSLGHMFKFALFLLTVKSSVLRWPHCSWTCKLSFCSCPWITGNFSSLYPS